MAISFPTNLDSLQNPTATDNTEDVDHAGQHSDANDAIEALEAKVGKNSSAVTTSHDYKLSGVTGSDKAVSKTGTETLTNKTLTTPTLTTPIINLGSDATGDIYYRHSDGTLKRLAASEGKILKISSGVPTYAAETVTEDASTTVKGVVEEATLAEIDANTAAGGTSARLFVNPSTLGKSTDGTLGDNSDAKIPSQKAVKTYVDNSKPKNTGYTSGTTISNTGTTDTVITHGLSVVPKIIVVYCSGLTHNSSWGTALTDGVSSITTQNCIRIGNSSGDGVGVTNAIACGYFSGEYKATITAVSSSSFTITFPSAEYSGFAGTPVFVWEVFA